MLTRMACSLGMVALLGIEAASQLETPLALTGQIVDADTGAPLPARIYIQGGDGAWHFPRSQVKDGSAVYYKKQRGDNPRCTEMHTTLSAHPFSVEVPAGKYTITVERGHEYVPVSQVVALNDKQANVTLKLRRWIDMAKHGWYSGDTHVHRTLEELPNVMRAEDLNVAFPLIYWVTEAFAPPRSSARSAQKDPPAEVIAVDRTHLIYPRNTEYEIFTVNKKPHALGAIFFIGHKRVFDQGAPPLMEIAKQARADGALLDLDKPNWPWSMILVALLNVDLYELANNHMWRTEFGFPNFGEPPPDYMKIERDAKGFTERGWIDFNFQNYYALLNCGFNIKPTAGTASGVHPVPLGFGRVYVHQPTGFSFESWRTELKKGNSFVSTGPMLLAHVNDERASTSFLTTDEPQLFQVHGIAHSALPLERIEIIVNGEVQHVLKPVNKKTERGGYESPFNAKAQVQGSSWIAVRCWEPRADGRLRYAHTAPWHIHDMRASPPRPRRVETDFLIKRVKDQIERSKDVLPAAALAEYQQALKVYEKIAQRARD